MQIQKRYLLFLVLLFTIIRLTAQVKKQVNTSNFWYKLNTAETSRIGLPNLIQQSKAAYWRWWYHGQTISYVIDLYQNKDLSLGGFITLYTKEYVDESKELPTHRIYSKRTTFSTSIIDSIYYLFETGGIVELPTDSLIKGWQHGLDGITNNLEYVTPVVHTFTSYWTPKAQENLEEAKLVQRFADSLTVLIHYNQLQEEFTKQIPFESYNTGGPSTAIRILTIEQIRKYRKERGAYRKQSNIQK